MSNLINVIDKKLRLPCCPWC